MFFAWIYLPHVPCNFTLDYSNILPSFIASSILVIYLTILKVYFFSLLNVSHPFNNTQLINFSYANMLISVSNILLLISKFPMSPLFTITSRWMVSYLVWLMTTTCLEYTSLNVFTLVHNFSFIETTHIHSSLPLSWMGLHKFLIYFIIYFYNLKDFTLD